MTELIVTVDGPGGSGKSTVSRAVAERLAIPHLDTGAFYRAATLATLRSGVDLDDADQVAGVIDGLTLDQISGRMLLNGEDVSNEIRSQAVTAAVSQVSAYPQVRRLLVGYQRAWVTRHGNRSVVEGRDIGSVVFPDATLKIYLDARPEVRAVRRAIQAGSHTDEVLMDLRRRDRLDSTRTTSPLSVPQGAVVIDTSDLTFDEVVSRVMDLVSTSD